MKVLHVTVESDDGWLIAQGLEEPGVITQARTLDELLANIRDAAGLLLGARDFHIEFIVPPEVRGKSITRFKRPLSRAAKPVLSRRAG